MSHPRASASAASVVAVLAACSSGSVAARGDGSGTYLDDAAYRRSELVASLVNPANGYSQARLAHYDSGGAGDWADLPEWNPQTLPLGSGGAAAARDLDADLLALGEDAFFHYPTQLAPEAAVALLSPEAAAAYGLWSDAARGAGGLVRATMADGTSALAFTCSTCHARAASSGLVVGAGNDALDVGAMIHDHAAGSGAVADEASLAPFTAWGPGRVDVTTVDGSLPVRIPDLRPVRWLTHLQQDATVEQRDLDTLAIRIETLIVTSSGATLRPPRRVALALATYVWSLASSIPDSGAEGAQQTEGETLFATRCRGCHRGEGFTGPPVPLSVVGTDPAVGRSPDRGTGMYRVPSLRGVGSRGMLLHDASLPSVAALFDPARVAATFAGGRRGPGAVPGHPFGLDLDDAERAALVAYVQTR